MFCWNYACRLRLSNEQRRIVAKIEELFSELDASAESLTRARAQLKTYRQALLKAAFEGKLTADWRGQRGEVGGALASCEGHQSARVDSNPRRSRNVTKDAT